MRRSCILDLVSWKQLKVGTFSLFCFFPRELQIPLSSLSMSTSTRHGLENVASYTDHFLESVFFFFFF